MTILGIETIRALILGMWLVVSPTDHGRENIWLFEQQGQGHSIVYTLTVYQGWGKGAILYSGTFSMPGEKVLVAGDSQFRIIMLNERKMKLEGGVGYLELEAGDSLMRLDDVSTQANTFGSFKERY